MGNERLSFDIFANADRAVAGFAAAGKSAQLTADEVKKLSDRLTLLNKKSATAKISVDDTVAKAKIDKLNLQLLKLGRKVTADVSVEGAVKAAVEMSALNAELEKFKRKSQGGLLSALRRGGGGFGGIPGIASLISGGGLGGAVPGLGAAGAPAAAAGAGVSPVAIGGGAIAAIVALE